jgi:hypothetical protein
MKHIAALFALMGMSTMGWAQVETGTFSVIPRVGLNLSTISDESLTTDVGTMKSKYKAGAMAGVDLEYRISKPLAASVGAYYSREGCNYKDNVLDHPVPGTYNVLSRSYFTIDYLKIPVMARWYVTDKFSVGTGVQAGIGLWNRTHTESQEVKINNGSYTYSTDIEEANVKGNGLRNVLWSVPVSVAVEYERVILDLRYSIPLSKVYQSDGKHPDGDERLQCWSISVGYRI